MKIKYLLVLMVGFLVSCDNKQQSPTYPPPVNLGNGTVLIFDAKDTSGNFAFHNNLNQYFQDHLNERFVSMQEIEHDSTGAATKYVIIIQYITTPVVASPTTAPVVAPSGEINYPK